MVSGTVVVVVMMVVFSSVVVVSRTMPVVVVVSSVHAKSNLPGHIIPGLRLNRRHEFVYQLL